MFSGFFSAVPRHPYLWELFQRAVYNMRQIGGIQRDYDILYICANAMMSERYDKIGQYQKDIELVPHHITKCMISLTSKGSWRTDKKK